MPISFRARISLALVLSGGLAACASEPLATLNDNATARPAELKTIEVSEAQRRALSRELQLQTPVSLAPEDTGAPAPGFYANGDDVGHNELVANGVDVAPDLRVWQRWPAGTRQIYGDEPTVTEPILRPVVVAPQ